ncbi:MAG: serine/threonine protein kinase [Polyangiaceae bacterium]
MAPSADPFGLVGQVLDGHFRVDRWVGEGGFSVVYQGTHIGLSEPIAVKCLKLPFSLGSALVESFVRRFRDESRLHYRLSQGNLHIVRSIASGTTLAPATSALVPYTVLEWLDGQSLADEFADRRARGLKGRPLSEIVRLLDSAIDAVAYAHVQGVIHRDLNPGNLFLARTGGGTKLKVLDFGVAKILSDSALAMGPSARTLGNVRMFAPAYGAPEQFDDRIGVIGAWTDVYALALVVLEALTDRSVVEGEHLGEFAMRALDKENRPTPRSLGVAVGDDVENVLARATALSPADRPQDAGEFWGMLKHALRVDGQPGHAIHSVRRQSSRPPPVTLRMEEQAPRGSVSPVIELARSSGTPPPVARVLGGTLRMEGGSARSATEALAATPFPSNAAAPRALSGTPSSPTAALPPTPPPTEASSPGFALVSPPLTVLSSAPPPASRAPIVVVVVLSIVFALAFVAASWLAISRMRHG